VSSALVETGGVAAASPAAEALWYRQQAANAAHYAGFPVTSCSVEGHAGALAFREFLGRLGAGDILDIGCGPQPVPLYLEGYLDDHWVAGIDPLPPAAGPHPFEFVQGRAERLPWVDRRFATVIAATSMDHLIDPARVVGEVRRVLHRSPHGRLFVWATFWPDAVAYDPQQPPAELVDGCHAYHLGPWFRHVLAQHFRTVREEVSPTNPNDTFLELVPL